MLGALPSPRDYRDGYVASIAADTKPSILSVIFSYLLPFYTNLSTVLDQNKTPSCVSHSVVYLMKLYWFFKTGKWIDFSPRFLDILSAEDWIPLEGGRVPRTVLKKASQYGCCTNATLLNDTENLTIAQYRDLGAISPEAYAEALKYRIPGFIRIPIDFNAMRNAVKIFGAVSSTFMIGQELWTPSWQPRDTNPMRTPATVVSGHQMTTVGWSGVLNRIRNQWSTLWGSNGESTYDFAKWKPFITESWVIAEVPTDIVNFLKTLPSPNNFSYTWNTDMKQGQTSDDIKYLQVALMILGDLPPIPPDSLGIYGPRTAAAVYKFQSEHGINPVSYSVGPKTRASLNGIFQ